MDDEKLRQIERSMEAWPKDNEPKDIKRECALGFREAETWLALISFQICITYVLVIIILTKL